VEFLETFPYIIKLKKGNDNVVVGALSRCYVMLCQLDYRIFGHQTITGLDWILLGVIPRQGSLRLEQEWRQPSPDYLVDPSRIVLST
jgi:hypothetical protein